MSNFKMRKSEDEYAFTLIELLVVIVIIGVLASIAIPAFLNQRQRANDATVQSDVKNSLSVISTNMFESSSFTGGANGSKRELTLSPGVVMSINGGSSSTAVPGEKVWCVRAYHPNAKQYGTPETALSYKHDPIRNTLVKDNCSAQVSTLEWFTADDLASLRN